MMIVDDTLVLSDRQPITASAASTNQIDLRAPGTAYGHSAPVRRDMGVGGSAALTVLVTEAFNNLTSLTVSLQIDNDPAFGSPTTVASSGAIPVASLVAGYQLPFPSGLPEGTTERYVRLFYNIAGAAPTVGRIFAGFVAGRQTN
jgi:hypothetical protein